MADWRDSQMRYLVHFSDGGSDLCYFDERLTEGETFSEGDSEYKGDGQVQHPAGPA